MIGHNVVYVQGDYTWFTHQGRLFRKHVDQSTSELWHEQGGRGEHGFHGLLHEQQTTLYKFVWTTANSPLPAGLIVNMQVDKSGNIWFATEDGRIAMFDGIEWHLNSETGMHTWPANSPYVDQLLIRPINDDDPRIESLVETIFPLYRRTKFYSCVFAHYPPSSAMCVDRNGTVYLATRYGVYVFKPSNDYENIVQRRITARRAFPNPSATTVTFAIDHLEDEPMTVDILDLTGRKRRTGIAGSTLNTTVDVSGFEEGVYTALFNYRGMTAATTFTVRR